jgi:hypothetical protein
MQNLRFSRRWLWTMVSSGMLRRVALVRTDVSEELSASFIRVTRIGELGTLCMRRLLVTASVVPSLPILVTLMNEALSSSETSVFARATRRNIPEDTILLSPTCLEECHRIVWDEARILEIESNSRHRKYKESDHMACSKIRLANPVYISFPTVSPLSSMRLPNLRDHHDILCPLWFIR